MATATQNEVVKAPVYWELLFANFAYYGWTFGTQAILAILFLRLTVEGLRISSPAMGIRMIGRIDLGMFVAVVLWFAVSILWKDILRLWLGIENSSRWATTRYVANHKFLVVVLGLAILSLDAVAFYRGLKNYSWGTDAGFAFDDAIVTAFYVSLIVFVQYFGLVLRERVNQLKEK